MVRLPHCSDDVGSKYRYEITGIVHVEVIIITQNPLKNVNA